MDIHNLLQKKFQPCEWVVTWRKSCNGVKNQRIADPNLTVFVVLHPLCSYSACQAMVGFRKLVQLLSKSHLNENASEIHGKVDAFLNAWQLCSINSVWTYSILWNSNQFKQKTAIPPRRSRAFHCMLSLEASELEGPTKKIQIYPSR